MVKPTAAAKAEEAPTVLELVLETKKVKSWDAIITLPGRELVKATVDEFKELKKRLEKEYEKNVTESVFSEIAEVQKILMALPIKRDDKGKPILHPQAGVEQIIDVPLEEQRPRNRILWAIEDALKGKEPEDVKKITITFRAIADLKQPKYADALLLCDLVGWSTRKNRKVGLHFVDLAMKFVHIRNEDGDLVEDDEARATLRTQAKAILS